MYCQIKLLIHVNLNQLIKQMNRCFMAGILQLPLMVQELAWTKSEHNKDSAGILFSSLLVWVTHYVELCGLSICIFAFG